MKKVTLLPCLLFCSIFSIAQTGDEINDAVLCPDATPITATHVSDATSASSTSAPNCVSGGVDAFYYNIISSGDNKINIGMNTSYGVMTTIDYQILRAPGGDINNLVEIKCSSFDVVVGVFPVTPGGSFNDEITTNINLGDVYYLRVYKPTGLAAPTIEALFDATTVTMTSAFDGTLSLKDSNSYKQQLLVRQNEIKIINNTKFNQHQIFSLDGKLMAITKQSQPLSFISIEQFPKGIYILNLESINERQAFKFIKH